MQLSEGLVGHSYTTGEITTDAVIAGRLRALGIKERTSITIMSKKHSGTVIVKVRGTRLAMGSGISGRIEVKEALADADHSHGNKGWVRRES